MIAAASDGSFYVSEDSKIKEIRRDGTIRTIVGTGSYGSSPDGTPANLAAIHAWDIAVGPDDTLYINDSGNFRIRRIVDGLLITVAGTGVQTTYPAPVVDGRPATTVPIDPQDIAVGPDGTLYIADRQRVLAVGPDGVMRQVAGAPGVTDGTSGDGGPALQAGVEPLGLAVGPDGSVYISDNRSAVRRIRPDGIIELFAGAYFSSGQPPLVLDGESAIAGALDQPWGMAVAADGTVLIGSARHPRIRAVGSDGVIKTVVGNGEEEFLRISNGDLARATALSGPWDVAMAPDGSILFIDYYLNVARRTQPMFPPSSVASVVMPSRDGSVGYVFEQRRHVRTVDTVTGAVLYRFAYDAEGLLVSVIDADDNITRIERDGSGRATAVVAPGGQRTTLSIDASGLTAIANPAGETHHFTYDNGFMTARRDPRGSEYRYTFDDTGRLTRDADPAGGFIALTRNAGTDAYSVLRTSAEGRANRYDVLRLGDASEERTTFGPNGLPAYGTFLDGSVYTFSSNWTSVEVTDSADPRFGAAASVPSRIRIGLPSGLSAEVTYEQAVELFDPFNPLSVRTATETITANGRAFTNVYDATTRRLTTTTAAGRTSVTTLDGNGRVVSVEVPGLATLHYGYDSAGRVTEARSGTRTFTLGYTARNELESITDPLSRISRYTYDDGGRVTTQTLPDSRQIGFDYDSNGNLKSLTPPSRAAHRFSYTPVNLTETYEAPGAVTRYVYSRDRELRSIVRPDSSAVAFGYDAAGRLSSLRGGGSEYRFAYDSGRGTLQSVTAPDGGALAYTYDGALLTSTTWSGGTVTGSVAYEYDHDFRIVSENGVSFVYDPDGLLTAAGTLQLRRNASNGLLTGTSLGGVSDAYTYDEFGEITDYMASYTGAAVRSFTYARDALGRITAMGANGYEYDTAGRLVRVTNGGAPVAEYDYDANSNRIAHRYLGGTTTATYDDQDRLLIYGDVVYEYTQNGELRSKTVGGATTTFAHDAFGDLRSVQIPGRRIDYLIDAQGRRIGRKVDGVLVQRWLYADQLRVVVELDGTGIVVSHFVYGSRSNVPDYMTKGGVTYRIISDHLGSPRLIVSAADGMIAQELEYDEFGRVLSDTNPGFQPFGFAGGLYDRDTGLVRFGARDYDAQTGRWITKEPLGFAGGDTNFYAYAFSDPINHIDPNGLYAGWDDAAFLVGGALVGAAGQGLADAINGEFSGWGAYGRAAAGGAVAGIVTLYAGPIAGGAAGALATNALNQEAAIRNGTQCGVDWGSLVLDTTVGGLTGRAFGAANMSGGVRRGSVGHVYKTTKTALKNGTITHIRPATGVKMFRGALEEHQIPLGTVVGVGASIAASELAGIGGSQCGCR